MKRLLALALLLPLAAVAQDTADDPATLTVKPLLCIVDQRTPVCDMQFLIAWQSDDSGYYCVFSELETGAVRCWTEAASGEMTDERSIAETFSYWLSQGEDEPVLAKATVDVLQKSSSDRRRNRRTRHVWDIL